MTIHAITGAVLALACAVAVPLACVHLLTAMDPRPRLRPIAVRGRRR